MKSTSCPFCGRGEDGIVVRFADGTDDDTIATIFKGIPDEFAINVNGRDLWVADPLAKHNGVQVLAAWIDDTSRTRITIPWTEVREMLVY